MAKVTGTCRIDSIEIAEITMRARENIPGAGLQAVYVLRNDKTGERFGSGTFNIWSDDTTNKINEALRAMEADIASMVFEDATTDSGDVEVPPQVDAVRSL